MPNMTKKEFFVVLKYTTKPKLSHRDTGQWHENTGYLDILLDYESIDLIRIRTDGIDVKVILAKEHSVLIGCVRYHRFDSGDGSQERFEDKLAKYNKWLQEFIDGSD